MPAVVQRTSAASRLRNSSSTSTSPSPLSSPSSSAASATATPSPRRPSTRASRAAAAAAAKAMSVSVESTPSVDAQDGRMLTPPPMSARSELAFRLGETSIGSPVSERMGSRASSPASHNSAAGTANNSNSNTTSLLAQNRAMLLSGLNAKGDVSPLSPPVAGLPLQRRDSGNSLLQANRRLTPLDTVSGAARLHPLSAQHSLTSPMAQSPRTISPCVYVKAVGPRRPSASSVSVMRDVSVESSSDDKDEITKTTTRRKKPASSASSAKSSDSLLSTPPPENRLVVSARVTPANTEKKPFTLQREFDLQELVEALPRPDYRRPSAVNILPSPVLHSPQPTPFQSPDSMASKPAAGTDSAASKKRPAPDDAPASPHTRLRRHTRQSSQQKKQQQQQQQQQQSTPTKELLSPSQFVANGLVPIPLCPHPSLGRIPGLAAIILSRRVEAGDTIEIPVPFPAAWPATVSYAYKSVSEAVATSEIKANLEYLGGQVTEV